MYARGARSLEEVLTGSLGPRPSNAMDYNTEGLGPRLVISGVATKRADCSTRTRAMQEEHFPS